MPQWCIGGAWLCVLVPSAEYTIGITVLIVFAFGVISVVLMVLYFRHYLLPKIWKIENISNFNLQNRSSVDNESNIETQMNNDTIEHIMELKCPKFLDELCKKQKNSMYDQNELYIWFVIILGSSYCIPAVQLVMKQQFLNDGKYKLALFQGHK